MNLLINIIIFVIVLIFYLNLVEEYKIGQDLDVFETDYENVEQLNRVCKNKQPVVFKMDNGFVIPDSHFINTINPVILAEKYGKENVFLSLSNNEKEPEEEPVSVPLEMAIMVQHEKLFENNHDFIMDLPIHHYYQSIDPFLKPFGTIQTEYDFVFGNTTGLRCHQYHSFFVYAIGGDLDVKITPYKNIIAGEKNTFDEYVYPDFLRNNKNLLNCWKEPEDDEQQDVDITFLNIAVPSGFCLFIPPHWWFSIRHSNSSNGWTAVFKYDTIMSKVVNWIEKIRNNLLRTKKHSNDDNVEEKTLLEFEE